MQYSCGTASQLKVRSVSLVKLKVIQQVKKCCERLYNIQTVQIRQNKEQRSIKSNFQKRINELVN